MDDLPPPDSPEITADLLVEAYRCGVFPMADDASGEVFWFQPDPRGIIPLEGFTVARSLARRVRSGRFRITVDQCFEEVMRECSVPRSAENGSWMTEELLGAYCELHARGAAHSIEAWRDGRLVGGVYGVHLGAAFFGESMFSRPELGGTDASKVCLVHLVERLRARGFTLLDTQYVNDHLRQFGCREVTGRAYAGLLRAALGVATEF
ncbi:MAG: leucyl/phenylalanyl-tRNA--protein transferase [Planctomycetota bacterium]|nr:leucyl/phenylalanyl-tRNA--protein transferase [Planctomycetota bacterium]